MGHHEGGLALEHGRERLLDQAFGLGVDGARRFVEDDDGRIFQDDAGEGQELLLPCGESGAALLQRMFVAVLEAADKAVRVDELRRRDTFLIGGIRPSVADIFHDRALEDEGLLHQYADFLSQGLQRHFPDIMPVDAHTSLLHIIEPGQHVDDRGLARAGGAHEGDRLAGLHMQVKMLEHVGVLLVGEGDIVEVHLPLHVR